MAQEDDQNRDKQQQGESLEERRTRDGRSDSSDAQRPDRAVPPRPDQGADLEDPDEMDDDDRDEDSRPEGGANRRFNIG